MVWHWFKLLVFKSTSIMHASKVLANDLTKWISNLYNPFFGSLTPFANNVWILILCNQTFVGVEYCNITHICNHPNWQQSFHEAWVIENINNRCYFLKSGRDLFILSFFVHTMKLANLTFYIVVEFSRHWNYICFLTHVW
jgi:hypothetical protein